MKTWTVKLTNKAYKQLKKLPITIQDVIDAALEALEQEGPSPRYWDIKQLSAGDYRIRINYRYRMKYLVINQEVYIEVFYIGTREGAYK